VQTALKVKQRKAIEEKQKSLMRERTKYSDGTSMDSTYRYYNLSGKIDVLQQLANEKKVKRVHVDELREEIDREYREIRKIPKHQRDLYQTLQGVYLEAKLELIQGWVLPVLLGK
jgi:hypothetical protein